MDLTNDDSSSHALDGVDRDDPQNRRWISHVERLIEDKNELEKMTFAEVARYGGQKCQRRL